MKLFGYLDDVINGFIAMNIPLWVKILLGVMAFFIIFMLIDRTRYK